MTVQMFPELANKTVNADSTKEPISLFGRWFAGTGLTSAASLKSSVLLFVSDLPESVYRAIPDYATPFNQRTGRPTNGMLLGCLGPAWFPVRQAQQVVSANK